MSYPFTFKSKPLALQIEILETLLTQNPELGQQVLPIIEMEFSSDLVESMLPEDSRKLASAALLAVAYADVASVEVRALREIYQQKFKLLCEYFKVTMEDITRLTSYTSQIEELLK